MSEMYSSDGKEFRVVGMPAGYVAAYAQVEDEDGESFDGDLRLVLESALYPSPPKAKVNDDIAALMARRDDLALGIQTLEKERSEALRDAADRMAQLKQHKGLERLEDFLAGRITHYVESPSYGPPKIVALEDTKDPEEEHEWRDATKLLTLFGCSDGDLEWGLNRWKDGSGSYTTVVPCTSRAEAVKVVGELFAAYAATALDPKECSSPRQDWADRASEYGITLPPEYLGQLKAKEAERKADEISELKTKLQALQSTEAQ